jgi:sugar O-acyltransferase (sialic acid O-acetyltransferase NeuD family)
VTVVIKLPMAGPNDEFAEIIVWHKKKDDFVHKGDLLCAAETTKAVMDIEAEASGYLVPLVEEGQSVRTGEPIAALTEHVGEDISSMLAPVVKAESRSTKDDRRWTKKAELLARRHGLSLDDLVKKFPDTVIGEAEVLSALEPSASNLPGSQTVVQVEAGEEVERVLILGGARGGGATLVLDALARIPGQCAVGILDRDAGTHGQTIMGVPVLGPTSMAEELWHSGKFDAAIIAFNSNLDERATLFEDFAGRGIRFANVCDVTVISRLNVRLGAGNVILASSYLGPYATIGDNNFLSSQTCIEHHCRLGSHCAFGPSVTFSGRVTVGNKVRFGTNIAVEPDVNIGDDVVIASGATLTRSIPANSIVKARVDYAIRPRREHPKAHKRGNTTGT